MTSPKVSVLMSVYNNAPYLEKAVQSILNQTFSDFELIIVDDGSTDESATIIQNQSDSRIRFLQNEDNNGLAKSLNRGLDIAKGDYIARMDGDDISLPHRLETQVKFLDQHPEIGVLGSRMQVISADDERLFNYDVPLEHSLIVWNLFFGWTFAHPTVMMRAHLLKEVDGYNTSIAAAQDVELWSRLVGRTQFANLPEKLVQYRTHELATSIQKIEQQRQVLRETTRKLLVRLDLETDDTMIDLYIKMRNTKNIFATREIELLESQMKNLFHALLAKGWILPEETSLVQETFQNQLKAIAPDRISIWRQWLRTATDWLK